MEVLSFLSVNASGELIGRYYDKDKLVVGIGLFYCELDLILDYIKYGQTDSVYKDLTLDLNWKTNEKF